MPLTLPDTLITLMGIEKLRLFKPRIFRDLLPALPPASLKERERIHEFLHLHDGAEGDGPQEFTILMDNGCN